MANKTYRKYMKGEFDPSKIKRIENRNWIKPIGGCWASPVDAEYPWEMWASSEMPHWLDMDIVDFKLKESAKVYEIHCVADLLAIPLEDEKELHPDFEALESMGYDALELFLSDDSWGLSDDKRGNLYTALYGWDCDSIIIFNGDIIDMESVTPGIMSEEIKERIARSREIFDSYADFEDEEDCADVV